MPAAQYITVIGSPLDSFHFPELTARSPETLAIYTSMVQGFIGSFVANLATPFMHPSLYEQQSMPNAFLECLGICSLYTRKTPTNQGLVFRLLDAKMNSLISSASHIYQPRESLLAVQALILYLVIQLFDGDERQRMLGERNLGLLQTWTWRLSHEYCEAGLELETSWVMQESIRRTIATSVILQGLWRMITLGSIDNSPFFDLPISYGGWEKSGLLTYREFVMEWNEGKVTKLGEYERLLLKVCCHANVDDVAF